MQSFDIQPSLLPNSDTVIGDYLNNIFSPGTDAFQKLAYELQREFRFGGSPDVKRLHIDRAIFDTDKLQGSFRVVLDIDFTFGCEDVVSNKKDQTSEWNFKIDSNKGVILFSGSPYAESRSTADEF